MVVTRSLVTTVSTQLRPQSFNVMFRVAVMEIRKVKPQVIVATPGRLIDLLENYGLRVDSSKYQILDEGDKMLDMGFQ